MVNIIVFLIVMVIIALIAYFVYKATDKNSTPAEKISYFVLVIIIIIFIGIYCLDRLNIPTILGLNMNVNTQNWLSFIATSVTGMAGSVIGVIASVFITIYQIRKNNEENEQRDRKNTKIQNMPILKYNIFTNKEMIVNLKNIIFIKDEDATLYPFNISIKNVGMNTIRNLKVDLEFDNNKFTLIGEDSQEPLEKSEIKSIDRWLNLPCANNEYEMKLKVLYQDILTNWYAQEVEISYKTTNRYEKGEYKSFVDFIVKEDKELEEK